MFRPFRRSGPTPFQVMSSSWRGPTRPGARPAQPTSFGPPADPPREKNAAQIATREAITEPSAIQMPAGPLKVNPEAQKKQPKATIEVRRHTDPPVVRSEPLQARLIAGVIKSATALGAVTITVGELLKDRGMRLGQRLGLIGDSKRSRENGLPRKTVVLGFAALAAVILVTAWALRDRDGAVPPPLSQQNQSNVGDTNLSALLPMHGNSGTNSTNQTDAALPPVRQATPLTPPDASARIPDIEAQPKPKLSRTNVDPREKGHRYYILATYSVNKEEYLMPLLEYLWSQGVEAGAINGHNSGFFQVIALQGFTRDEINSKAHKQYEESLRRLGRKWKAQGGGDDLQGLYLQEYSGTQAKLSIMKAN